ncbi:MAG: EAL domain-containing protein [Oscillospiraceae bacterium]|nr:EAL domain-containing protein [Oscillospiraceae bacterium]
MDKKLRPNSNIIERLADSLRAEAKAPAGAFVVLILLYIISVVMITVVARSEAVITLGDMKAPLDSFAGVFSALSNICVIMIVVFYGKSGFIASLVMLLGQFPSMVTGLLIRHQPSAISGLFTNIFAIVAAIMIYANKKKVNEYQDKITKLAVTDRLTSLPNRFACVEITRRFIKRGEDFAAVSIDVNNFKSINDTMGYATGNKILIEIAERLKAVEESETSTEQAVARLSGDEFALLIRRYTSEEQVLDIIKKYESAINSVITIDGFDLYITASFGYAFYPNDAVTADALFICANAAMEEVKRAGSSRHIMRFTPNIVKEERTLELESRLRTALDSDGIYFNLQPQFDLSHRLRGFEALARMNDENGRPISPGEFIPVAEKVGLVDKIDGVVLRKSAEFFGPLLKKCGMDITLSVNVSVRHLMNNDFIDELKNVLETTGIPADHFEIEITESIMIDSVDKALRVISEVEKLGVKIAIDDFGTGYSSLSYLNKFPADLLKIDKSFIDTMNTNDSSRQYVAAIISIGHIMGFDVISEGVEDTEQLDTLKEIGCDYIQGFIWGRPLSMAEAEKVVLSQAG